MTTPDIVERLRRDQYKECDCWRCVACEDAADEIERLRAELSSAQSTIINLCDSVKSGGKFYSDFLVKFDELRSRLADAEKVVEGWSQYDDADPQVRGECLNEARDRTTAYREKHPKP